MCGLAGLLCTDGRPAGEAEEAVVRRMCDLIAYRGPDDAGTMSSGPACLGSRRLAIQDLSTAGHMPMSDAGGRYCIAYNGEVYNFHEIRVELEKEGAVFRSHCDTEVVVEAWKRWGERCLARFAGMWAIAIFDRQTGELVLIRDRLGVKPLYWTVEGARLLFASEIKALVRQRSRNAVDHQSLAEWWLYRNIDALTPATLIEGVSQLLPGHILRARGDRIEISTWYSPIEDVDEAEYARHAAMRPEQVVAEVERQLDTSIRLRLVSDAPVGTLLSGGLDSCLVTAMSSRHADALTAFHVSVTGYEQLDERRFAEALTDHHKIPLVPLSLDAGMFRSSLAHAAWLEDLPIGHANSVAYYLISEVARDHGVKVLQSGEGADELFGGYAWNYRRRMRLQRLAPVLRRLPWAVKEAISLSAYAMAGLPVTSRRFRELLPPTVRLLDRYARADWQEQCAAAYHFVRKPGERDVLGAMLADLGDFLSPLLRRLDRMTMGASVECREPFLDHRLVRTAVNLPLEYKVGRRADKWVLKQIARRYLPDSLIWRKKMGFPLPLADLIAPLANPTFLAGGFCETELGLGRRGIERLVADWQQWTFGAFGLIALEIWGRLYLRAEQPEAVTERILQASAERGRAARRPAPAEREAAPAG
ncbi:MAG TPA: asparagine synthase (glutamine-hydrolyzing) [Geminicoccaceae bacterium]|nr:asparagine synthase (glutamine-hydrolyzing) [Geminicoccus sp.]HMU53294.1 asparagine synthase (glutamine-hydrolyzing) [Geminicoccaceae bacterium]